MGVIWDVVGFAILVTVVVVVHEAGHYIVAKASGVRVDEFAVGFGPRLLSRRRGETVYAIRALPVGGFVRMAGMLGLEGEADAGPRNFFRASKPRRMATLLAGVFANFVLGAVCLGVLSTQSQPSQIIADSPAAHAGLADGDTITQIDGRDVDRSSPDAESSSLFRATSASEGAPVQVAYMSPAGVTSSASVTPHLVIYHGGGCNREILDVLRINGRAPGRGDPAALLSNAVIDAKVEDTSVPDRAGTSITGVHLGSVSEAQGSLDDSSDEASWKIGYQPGASGQGPAGAVVAGLTAVPSFVSTTTETLARLFVQPSCAQQFVGPVGIAAAAGTSISGGWQSFLFVVGEVSLSLGFVNLLPIPFLDGGRFLIVVVEAIRGRRLDPRREAAIHAAGLAFLILLVVLRTIGDIHNLSAGSGR